MLLRWKKVAIIGGRKLLLRWKEVAIQVENEKFFSLFIFNCHINIGGVKYGKKIKLSIIKNCLYR